MTVTVYENTSVVTFKTRVQVMELAPNRYVFKRAVSRSVNETEGSLKVPKPVGAPQANEGVVTKAELKKLIGGKPFKTLPLRIMRADVRETFRTHSFSQAWSMLEKVIHPGESVYDAFETGGATLDDLVEFRHSSHDLADHEGNLLPTGIFYDYIDTQMHNRAYDMEKAATVLLKDPRVRLLGHDGNSMWNDKPDRYKGRVATTAKEAIWRVPYYNADNGRSECLYFTYAPTAAEYRVMVEWCKANGRGYIGRGELARCIFELDMLGLRAAGAARFDDFYGHDRE